MNYTKCLEQFVKTGKDFLIVNGPSICKKQQRLLVLDSSFNPPHLAHLALASEALRYNFNDSYEKEILLLLSIKNADKTASDLQQFGHRMSMMRLMANSLEKLDVNVSIGLTNCAKFADKARSLGEYYPNSTLTFLLGFDTLIRVLDPKYYVPLSLADSLAEFMSHSELFCLTRVGNDEDLKNQTSFVDRMSRGEFPEVPADWAKKIFVESLSSCSDSIDDVSSTSIRRHFAQESNGTLPLLAEIENYIKANGLYSETA